MPTLFDAPAAGRVAARPGVPVPRPYQRAAVWGGGGQPGVMPSLAEHGSTLLVLPTGGGKTVCMGYVAAEHLRTEPTDVLVLAHREELVFQAQAELEPILGVRPEVEMGPLAAGPGARCVVASVQTLFGDRRRGRYSPLRFGLVVVDEAHHAVPSNKTYARVLDHFKGAKVLGVTATPRRADDLALGQTFSSVAYEFGIREAVAGGWLVPVEQHLVTVRSLDLSEVDTRAGDLDRSQLGRAVTGDRRVSWEIAAAVAEHCGSAPTLIFSCPRAKGDPVGQGEQLRDCLNSLRPNSAVFLSGETPPDDRRRQVRRFEAGEYPYLVGCSLFTEGFNVPGIANVVMARPTKSVVYYTQAVGRGTRTLRGVITPELAESTPAARHAAIAASAKPKVTVFDFCGNSGRHKLITAVDIFAGEVCPEARERVKERAAAGPVDVFAAAAEEQELAAERRRVRAVVETHTQAVDPFGYSDSGGRAATKRDRTDPASADQAEWIKSHGGVWRDGMTVGEAGAHIADIKRRWKLKLCSPRQERTLARLGLCDGPVPKHHASALLDLAAARDWPKRMALPARAELSIATLPAGWQLRVGGVAVGPVFGSPADVRRAYEGLAAEPAHHID